MSDKPTVTDQTNDFSPNAPGDQQLASREDHEGFVAAFIKKANDIKSGRIPSGISKTFGKVDLDFSPEAVVAQAGLPTPSVESQSQIPQVPLEGLVELDSADRVTKIAYSDGAYTSPKYDGKGNLIELVDSDSSSWKKDSSGWNRYNSAGEKVEHLDGEILVSADGDIVARQNDGYTEVLSPDQSLTKINPDNTQVVFDAEGRVIKSVDAQGKTAYRRPDHYEGEIIKREVEPAVVVDTKGKQLEEIARDHLGSGATEQDVQRHVKEIAHLNDIKDSSKPIKQERLVLPGHTGDGAIVTEDTGHNRKTVWSNGTVVIKNADGTGSDVHRQDDGAYKEHNWGPETEQNYDVQRAADGRYELTPKHVATHYKQIVDVERARMEKLAEKIEDTRDREQFKKDMDAFSKRSDELQKSYQTQYEKQGLTPAEAAAKAEKQAAEEIVGTYREVARMMESPAREAIAPELRQMIAMQVMHHAADPTTIDQGIHPTCNVSTVEARLYSRSPSSVARVVADVAIAGQCTTRGTPPKTIKLDEKSLDPDSEAMYHPPSAAARSYSSQLFQVAAVNMAWEKVNQRDGTKFRYEQHEPTNSKDSGGRLIDYSKNPPQMHKKKDGSPDDDPQIYQHELVEIYNEIAATKESHFVIQRGGGGNSKVGHVGSPEQLGQRLEDMKKNGEMPAIILVHTGKEPFFTDSGATQGNGDAGGWHVVTVTGYDPTTGKVAVDNQWGETTDRNNREQIDLARLYDTMSSKAEDLDAEIAADRKADKIPTVKELERLELDRGTISDTEYEERHVKLILEQGKDWLEVIKQGPPTAERMAEHDDSVAKAREIWGQLPIKQRMRIFRQIVKGLNLR